MVATDKPYTTIGTRPVRPDGADKVTGRAQYGADISLPGMLFGRVKRSPHAHAHIKKIDVSRALALPGVKAVITNADFPAAEDVIEDLGESATNLKWLLDNILASDKALYQGHAIAAVAATDPHVAEDALQLIEVEYELLPPVMNVRDAMLESAPLLHPDMRTVKMLARFVPGPERGDRPTNIASTLQFKNGDVEQGFAESDIILEREFETTMTHQGYIEPQNGTAFWNSDDELTVWTSTQGAFSVRDQTAKIVKLPVSKVRVVPMEIGGGFGGKIPVYLEPLAAILSRQTGRPVKMSMNREEVFEGTGPTSGAYLRVKLGAKRDGTFMASEAFLAYEGGAYPGSPAGGGAVCIWGPYDIPNILVDALDVVVNKPKVAAYRAPGAPASEYAFESLVDELAEMLDMDPMDLRLKNAATEGTRRTDGTVFGVIGNIETMEAVKNSDHYRSEMQGKHRGRGVAMGYWGNAGMESSAYASVVADGTVALVIGATDIGGSRASHAMQMAETLGIPYEDVKPKVVDTDSVGYTGVTGGSRTTFAGGWAVYEAAMDIRSQLEERAAAIWEVDRNLVRYEDGGVNGPDGKRFSFRELAGQLPHTGGMIQGRADINKSTQGPSFAAHIADVEVDPETGKVQVLRYTAIQDVGTAVHPSYVEGQIQGGAVQGIGMALSEEYFYDEQGQMRNASWLDYRMPTTLDLPMIETILVEVPNPGHPYGVRGVAEVPIVPALAAVANAIYHATGLRMRKLPASPRAVLEEMLDNPS
ncbi:MAG: xanthine dehydrogenase family protein molybdopterin-binding subunit [Dehalococcoidia bacterium]